MVYQEDNSVNYKHQQRRLNIHKTTAIVSRLWYWRERHKDRWNRRSRNRSTQICATDYWWRCKISEERRNSFFDKRCWTNWTSTGKEMKLDLNPTAYTAINSKQIMDLNVKYKTIRNLDKNKIEKIFVILDQAIKSS